MPYDEGLATDEEADRDSGASGRDTTEGDKDYPSTEGQAGGRGGVTWLFIHCFS